MHNISECLAKTWLIGAACLLLLTACEPTKETIPKYSVNLRFIPYYQEEVISCGLIFKHKNAQWQLESFGFFVSELQFNKLAKQASTLSISSWQNQNTALVWFSNTCENKSAALKVNNSVNMLIDSSKLNSLQQILFTLAVPFESNHLNPLSQASPLSAPEMFWSWQAGHKFLRLDAKQLTQLKLNAKNNAIETISSRTPLAKWAFHLGSLGCESKSSLRAPSSACAMPNRFTITIPLPKDFALIENSVHVIDIKVDIAALLHNIDIETASSCMFALTQDASCKALITNLAEQGIFSALDAKLTP